MIDARLKQARLLAGMTQRKLAAMLEETGFSVTAAAISKYEKGKSFPSAQFLLLASTILEVPSTYFSHESTKPVEWLGFRCRQKLSKTERNKLKAYASDVAELQIELRELLYPNSRPALPTIQVNSLDDAEEAAERLREVWDVGDRPLDNLVQTAEDREIVVIGWTDNTGLFDGLSGRCGDRPVAVINTEVPKDRLRLSLAHEIGYLAMDVSNTAIGEEKLAYRFAASFLVPAKHARYELGTHRNHLEWGELESLKRKYGMSMAAWLMRARDLHIINQNVFELMWREFSAKGWRRVEPEEYFGDEEPLQLKQMSQRAVSEGLVSVDRISRIALDILDDEPDEELYSRYPDALELLAMDAAERDAWMEKFSAMADKLEFEDFEPFGEDGVAAWQ